LPSNLKKTGLSDITQPSDISIPSKQPNVSYITQE
jgi:hypothetical protein